MIMNNSSRVPILSSALLSFLDPVHWLVLVHGFVVQLVVLLDQGAEPAEHDRDEVVHTGSLKYC